MSRRVSQRKRDDFSELVRRSAIEEQDVDCGQRVRPSGGGARKLVYRRLRGIENTFNGEWPKTTNIRCWNCKLPFKSVPIPIVQEYDAVRGVYDVYGITCSPSCSKAFISGMKNNDGRTRMMWQHKMLVEVFGWPADKPIPKANPWEELEVYGGYKTVEEWRRHDPGVTVRIKKPPFVPFHIFTETELRGLCVIDHTDDREERADTLEEQAIQHGAVFSLKDLKRPPEDEIVRTVDDLKAKHPDHSATDNRHGFFQQFLDTHTLPTDEECARLRAKRKEENQEKRRQNAARTTKRKKKDAAAAAAAAEAEAEAEAAVAAVELPTEGPMFDDAEKLVVKAPTRTRRQRK